MARQARKPVDHQGVGVGPVNVGPGVLVGEEEEEEDGEGVPRSVDVAGAPGDAVGGTVGNGTGACVVKAGEVATGEGVMVGRATVAVAVFVALGPGRTLGLGGTVTAGVVLEGMVAAAAGRNRK